MADLLQTTQANLLQPDYPELQQLNRQQAFAQNLMNTGLQGQPQGQMVSGWYVKPSITQALNPLVQALTGAYLGNKAEQRGQELAAALRGKQQEAVQNYINALNPTQTELAGPTPNGAPLQTVNQPDYNAAFTAATSPYAPAALQSVGYEMLKPQKLGEGETLNRFNFNTGQLTPYAYGGEKLPTEYKEYQKAKEGGYGGTFFQYQQDLKRAGASNVSVNMGKSVAEQIGPMLKDSQAQAASAVRGNDAANKILTAINTNQNFAGPGSKFQVFGAQLADKAGIGGKDTATKLANTRATIQGLAQMTLEGRQQMRGQGAISNSEGQLAERVNSGDIDSLSTAEIAQLANAAKRYNDYTISQHNQKLDVLRKDPNSSALAPFYEVPNMPTQTNGVKYLGPAQ